MMASGLPTIVTDYHSFNEITNDSCSICVHRGENLINEISLNLQNLISKPELRYTMGQAAINRAKTFDKDAYIARFDELMDIIKDGITGHEEIFVDFRKIRFSHIKKSASASGCFDLIISIKNRINQFSISF